mgnify:CR=1 FL=1
MKSTVGKIEICPKCGGKSYFDNNDPCTAPDCKDGIIETITSVRYSKDVPMTSKQRKRNLTTLRKAGLLVKGWHIPDSRTDRDRRREAFDNAFGYFNDGGIMRRK